jgi:hypothetical protein
MSEVCHPAIFAFCSLWSILWVGGPVKPGSWCNLVYLVRGRDDAIGVEVGCGNLQRGFDLWGIGYYGSVRDVGSTGRTTGAHPKGNFERDIRPECIPGRTGNCASWADAALLHRVFGGGGVLCGEPAAPVDGSEAVHLGAAVWNCGVPGDVLGGTATFKVPQGAVLDPGYGDCDRDTCCLCRAADCAGDSAVRGLEFGYLNARDIGTKTYFQKPWHAFGHPCGGTTAPRTIKRPAEAAGHVETKMI